MRGWVITGGGRSHHHLHHIIFPNFEPRHLPLWAGSTLKNEHQSCSTMPLHPGGRFGMLTRIACARAMLCAMGIRGKIDRRGRPGPIRPIGISHCLPTECQRDIGRGHITSNTRNPIGEHMTTTTTIVMLSVSSSITEYRELEQAFTQLRNMEHHITQIACRFGTAEMFSGYRSYLWLFTCEIGQLDLLSRFLLNGVPRHDNIRMLIHSFSWPSHEAEICSMN